MGPNVRSVYLQSWKTPLKNKTKKIFHQKFGVLTLVMFLMYKNCTLWTLGRDIYKTLSMTKREDTWPAWRPRPSDVLAITHACLVIAPCSRGDPYNQHPHQQLTPNDISPLCSQTSKKMSSPWQSPSFCLLRATIHWRHSEVTRLMTITKLGAASFLLACTGTDQNRKWSLPTLKPH